jgi:hypothetical protein
MQEEGWTAGDTISPLPPAHLLLAGGDVRGVCHSHPELAGHENLSTIQRYMHLSPAAKDAAISLLDEAASRVSGDVLETEIAPKEKPRG